MNREVPIELLQKSADALDRDLVGKQTLRLLIGASARLRVDPQWSDEQLIVELVREAYVNGRETLERISVGIVDEGKTD